MLRSRYIGGYKQGWITIDQNADGTWRVIHHVNLRRQELLATCIDEREAEDRAQGIANRIGNPKGGNGTA